MFYVHGYVTVYEWSQELGIVQGHAGRELPAGSRNRKKINFVAKSPIPIFYVKSTDWGIVKIAFI